MKFKILSTTLLFILSTTPSIPLTLAQGQGAPENRCFDLLAQQAAVTPAFADLDLSQVQKSNATQTSGQFSVKTYADFQQTLGYPVPKLEADLAHYPFNMDLVSSQYQAVPTAQPDTQHYPTLLQHRDHFLTTRVVTFGDKVSASFPGNPNPQNPRQYAVYTQHLAEGPLVSCNLVKVVPLVTEPETTTMGNIKVSESRVETQVVGEGDFRLAKTQYTITHPQDTSLRQVRTYGLSLGHNNSSKVLNAFSTFDLLAEAFQAGAENNLDFADTQTLFYQNIGKTNLKVASGLELESGIPLPLLEQLDKIQDQDLQSQLKSLLLASPASNQSTTSPSLTTDQALANIIFIVDQAGDVQDLSADNLKCLDLGFCEAILGVTDARVQQIRATNYLGAQIQRLEAQKQAALNAYEQGQTRPSLEQILKQHRSKLATLSQLEEAFKQAKIEFLELANFKQAGQLSEEAFNEHVREVIQNFETFANLGGSVKVFSDEEIKNLGNKIYQTGDLTTPAIDTFNPPVGNPGGLAEYWWYYLAAALIALVAAFFGYKALHKKTNHNF